MSPRALLISFVEWAGAFQRPQHLALGLARLGWQVDYASPGYLHRRRQQVASGLQLPAGLRVVQPAALPGSGRLRSVARLNQWLMQSHLVRQTQEPYDLVIFNDPRWAGVARSVPARRRVFDCMDDLSAAAPDAAWARAQEKAALAIADRVWTGTASLADRLTGAHPHVHFIPCGVDAGHFASPDPAQVEQVRALLPEGDGPLAGYFGVLNERVEMGLIEALLETGSWRVLLIGPATSRAPQLPRHPRLKWIGPQPYAALPAFLAHFDLGLIPYDITGPHRFLYPVKALEYLAAGCPVLSTPLPDVARFLSSYLRLAEGASGWGQAAGEIASQPDLLKEQTEQGQRYAQSRGWDTMVGEMLADLGGEASAQ